MAETRTCAFCGKTGKMTGEHLWPEWLEKIVPWSQTATDTYAVIDGKPRQRRGGGKKLTTDRINRVCATCNSTWMSDLENKRAKPQLTPFIKGETSLLDRETQETMATWTTKMALIFALTMPLARVPFPPRRYAEFMQSQRPPTNWSVRTAFYRGTRWPLFSWVLPFAITPPGIERPAEPNSHRTTFSIGQLILQVIGTDSGLALPSHVLVGGPARVVWPLTDPATWPFAAAMDDAGLARFAQPPGW